MVLQDPKFIFKLYMARGQYREAATTAIIIANEEQINGKMTMLLYDTKTSFF